MHTHLFRSATLRSLGMSVIAIFLFCGIFSRANAQALVEPVGGEVYKAGTPHQINWGVGVQIGGDVSYDNGTTWEGIFNLNNNGKYTYRYKQITSTQCLVRIYNQDAMTGAKSIIQTSNPFTVWSNNGIHFNVANPDTTRGWYQDSTVNIQWTTENATTWAPDSIKVLMYPDSVSAPVTIAAKLGGDATNVLWKVWHKPTTNARIQVTTTDGKALYSASSYFPIRGAAPSFTYPVQGTMWQIGHADSIRWSFTDKVDGPIKVEWSPAGGTATSWRVIDSTLPGTARSLAWTPTIQSTIAVIRITADSGYVKKQSAQFSTTPTSVDDHIAVASGFSLDQNFPNPFSAAHDNSVTTIPFTLGSPTSTGLRVFDLLGRTVAQTPPRLFEAGKQTLSFDAAGLQPGVYGYQVIGSNAHRLMMYVR